MSGRTVSGVISPDLYDVVQQAGAYEGTTVSALVSSALAFYLGLSGPARRTARYVLTSGSSDSRAALLDGCGRAIAAAGDQALTASLASKAEAMGDQSVTEAQIAEEAVQAVRKARQAKRGRALKLLQDAV
jgi:hypothetical protein